MNAASAHRFIAPASRVLLVVIFACCATLHAQTAHNNSPVEVSTSSATSADPAFIARANETLLHARAIIDKFFEQTSNVVCDEDVIDTVRNDRVDETPAVRVWRSQDLGGRQRPDRDRNVAHDLRRLRAMRNADSCPL